MTLQNGMIYGQQVRLYCDTAWLQLPNMEVAGFASKAVSGHLWPFAVIGTFIGHYGMPDLKEALDKAMPLDTRELLSACAGLLKSYHGSPDRIGRLLVASWDGAPQLHIMASDNLGFVPPCKPAGLLSYASSANDSGEYHEAVTKGFTPDRMLALIDRQRVTPYDAPGFDGCLGIGGTAVEIVVGANGVTSRVVQEWDDELGEPIGCRATSGTATEIGFTANRSIAR